MWSASLTTTKCFQAPTCPPQAKESDERFVKKFKTQSGFVNDQTRATRTSAAAASSTTPVTAWTANAATKAADLRRGRVSCREDPNFTGEQRQLDGCRRSSRLLVDRRQHVSRHLNVSVICDDNASSIVSKISSVNSNGTTPLWDCISRRLVCPNFLLLTLNCKTFKVPTQINHKTHPKKEILLKTFCNYFSAFKSSN